MSDEGRWSGDLVACSCDLGGSFICQSERICGTILGKSLVRRGKDERDAVDRGVVAINMSILAALED